jgi:transcriptional antiterminator NusG
MQDKFGRILGAHRRGGRDEERPAQNNERRLFPGYVFVEMVMDDDTWHLVKHTNKVTGFVGGAKNRPAPISEEEVQKIVSQMQEGTDKPRHKVEFMVGELVRVKEGPFTDFQWFGGRGQLREEPSARFGDDFGRSTPVELEFSQVEKT